jgi:hypothetical protein
MRWEDLYSTCYDNRLRGGDFPEHLQATYPTWVTVFTPWITHRLPARMLDIISRDISLSLFSARSSGLSAETSSIFPSHRTGSMMEDGLSSSARTSIMRLALGLGRRYPALDCCARLFNCGSHRERLGGRVPLGAAWSTIERYNSCLHGMYCWHSPVDMGTDYP